MTEDEIKAAILDWAVANNGHTPTALDGSRIVYGRQNAPRPARPYITIIVNTVNDSENSSVGDPDDEGIAEIVSDRRVNASISAYGSGSINIINNLRLSLEKVRVQESLRGAKLSFIRVAGGFDDTSEVVGSEMEERGQMDVEFRCAGIVEDNLGLIEQVDVVGIFEDARTGEYGELNRTVTINAGA